MIVVDPTCDAVGYDFMIDAIHEDNNIHHFENTGRNTNIETLTQKEKKSTKMSFPWGMLCWNLPFIDVNAV